MLGRFDLSEHFNDILRVISFSSADIMKRPGADLLMWSHYAGSGTGVRIGLELNDARLPLKHVQYSESRPKIDLCRVNHCDASRDQVFADFLVDCVLTKPKIWEYESELRTVIFLSHRPDGLCYATPLEQYKHISEQRFLIEVPNTCVKEIALGAKIGNVASAQDGMKEIRNNGFEHVKFSRAMFDDKYDYRYVNLFNE